MRKFNKVMVIAVVMCMVTSLFIGCGQTVGNKEQSSPTASATSEVTPFKIDTLSIEPLQVEKNVELTFAIISGSPNGFEYYVAQKKGWMAQAGINMQFKVFDNGPTVNEAMESKGWDITGGGLGGILSAILGHDALMISAAYPDQFSHMFFTRKDDPIIKAGKGNVEGYPNIYGTAEALKGREIMCPAGTPLHYELSQILKVFGLTLNDVKIANMDMTSVSTAFLAGQGDIAALWCPFNFSVQQKSQDAIVWASALDVDVNLPTLQYANPRVIENNPDKENAIIKSIEIAFATKDWMKKEENKAEVLQIFLDMTDEHGISVSSEVAQQSLDSCPYYTFDECYKMFIEKADSGMLDVKDLIYKPFEFMKENDKYAQKDLDKYTNGDYFSPKYLEIIKARRDKQ